MMIKILCVGKLKEDYLTSGIKEYLKRLDAWEKVEIIEVKEYLSSDIKKVIEVEGDYLLDKIDKNDFVITLEIEGKMLTSEDLASKIDQLYTYGNSNITFVIGGSYGLSNKVKSRSSLALSFSKFTFPHQLMRLILLEQIYRAFTINNHKEYHK
ncbi:MAG: 23S rRNA (pseudouridine(1915)-N(3))-methyltransferase RlmH [Bacilli bacterium]|nr:23S rRNA (pseudouridine(1915)-N(3))-methyltransferase RlmH [Mollicutes bacterium]MDY3898614.1 23S rRNA (pseudouridine(1915)-N(3))-methyltransferase RlmH [Bacilli bacterium]